MRTPKRPSYSHRKTPKQTTYSTNRRVVSPGRAVTTGRKVVVMKRQRRLRQGSAVKGAENRLKGFRQASILAVAITGFILMLISPSEAGLGFQDSTELQETELVVVDSTAVDLDSALAEDSMAITSPKSTQEATDEALTAIENLWNSFFYNLPKILIAFGALLIAWLLVRLVKALLQKTIGRWHSSEAIITLITISIWLLGIGITVSIVAGDIRALVGSFGLIGLALSWSLQTPIESFTGWLLNSFKGYYRVGDRIRVGEVFGDVYKIDFLTTTVWEIGAPYSPGFVQAEQPTGRLVTFPNNEILSGTVTNLTGDFPYVWDELSIAVANESNLQVALNVIEHVALDLLGNYMMKPAHEYGVLLERVGIFDSVPDKPQVFMSLEDSWTNITIRYLVGARERRKWKSELTFRIVQEINKTEYVGIIIPVYPRQQVQFINPEGAPVNVSSFRTPETGTGDLTQED